MKSLREDEKSLREIMFKRKKKKKTVKQSIVKGHVTQGINFCKTPSNMMICSLCHKIQKNEGKRGMTNIGKSYFIKWICE